MRLVRSDIPTEELEAVRTNLGAPGDIVEDDDLDSGRADIDRAIRTAEEGDGSYQDRLEWACEYATRAHRHLEEFANRVRTLHQAGHLRVGNASAQTIIAVMNGILGALDEWLAWAHQDLRDLR